MGDFFVYGINVIDFAGKKIVFPSWLRVALLSQKCLVWRKLRGIVRLLKRLESPRKK